MNFNPSAASTSGWNAGVPLGLGGAYGSGSGSGNKEDASATPLNDENDYGDLVADILGEVGKKEEQPTSVGAAAGNQLGANSFGQPKSTEQKPHLLLDFRRGASDWPEGVEVCVTASQPVPACLPACLCVFVFIYKRCRLAAQG